MKKEPVYINPLTDFGFKRIFGTERNKDLLISFLNACISEHVGTITEIEYLPTELYGSMPTEKKVIFDIFCTDQDGRNFIVEMQRSQQRYFAHRAITYVSRVISHEAIQGEREYTITPIYSLNILDFDAEEFGGDSNFFWQVKLKDDNNNIFFNNIILFFVELRKFAAHLEKEDCPEDLRHWLYVLKNITSMDKLSGVPNNAVFRKLFEECQLSKLNIMEKDEYKKSVLEYEDVQDAMAYSMERGFDKGLKIGIERGLNEGKEIGIEIGIAEGKDIGLKEGLEEGMMKGMEEGRVKGMEEGRVKGMEEGREEGREEGKAIGKKEAISSIAKSMLAKDFDLETISALTGLPKDEIEMLRQS